MEVGVLSVVSHPLISTFVYKNSVTALFKRMLKQLHQMVFTMLSRCKTACFNCSSVFKDCAQCGYHTRAFDSLTAAISLHVEQLAHFSPVSADDEK